MDVDKVLGNNLHRHADQPQRTKNSGFGNNLHGQVDQPERPEHSIFGKDSMAAPDHSHAIPTKNTIQGQVDQEPMFHGSIFGNGLAVAPNHSKVAPIFYNLPSQVILVERPRNSIFSDPSAMNAMFTTLPAAEQHPDSSSNSGTRRPHPYDCPNPHNCQRNHYAHSASNPSPSVPDAVNETDNAVGTHNHQVPPKLTPDERAEALGSIQGATMMLAHMTGMVEITPAPRNNTRDDPGVV